MKSNRFFALLLALAMLLSMSALAESVTLTDMTGHEITIDEPVTRIVVSSPLTRKSSARWVRRTPSSAAVLTSITRKPFWMCRSLRPARTRTSKKFWR